MKHFPIYLLTSVLIGVNGPFTFTERFDTLQDCLHAKIYYHAKEQWAGRCRRVAGKIAIYGEERGQA